MPAGAVQAPAPTQAVPHVPAYDPPLHIDSYPGAQQSSVVQSKSHVGWAQTSVLEIRTEAITAANPAKI